MRKRTCSLASPLREAQAPGSKEELVFFLRPLWCFHTQESDAKDLRMGPRRAIHIHLTTGSGRPALGSRTHSPQKDPSWLEKSNRDGGACQGVKQSEGNRNRAYLIRRCPIRTLDRDGRKAGPRGTAVSQYTACYYCLSVYKHNMSMFKKYIWGSIHSKIMFTLSMSAEHISKLYFRCGRTLLTDCNCPR